MSEQQPVQMKFYDHIGVAEGLVSQEFCDILIKAFDYWYGIKYVKEECYGNGKYTLETHDEGDTQFSNGLMGRKDYGIYLEVSDPGLAAQVNQALGEAFEMYAKEYQGITNSADPVSSWTCKLQKTEPGGGFHVWHCENGSFMYRDRVLTWMIYLNDIPPEDGGATDFLYQKKSFHPTRGTVVLWPACYTHMHRGAFLTGDNNKYICTGWFLREPGQVSNRIIGESLGQVGKETKLNE